MKSVTMKQPPSKVVIIIIVCVVVVVLSGIIVPIAIVYAPKPTEKGK